MFYEDLKKRYSVDEPAQGVTKSTSVQAPVVPETVMTDPTATVTTEVTKSASAPLNVPDDIYAGLHPACSC